MDIRERTTPEVNEIVGGSYGSDVELELTGGEEHGSHGKINDLEGDGIGSDSSVDDVRTWSWDFQNEMHFHTGVLKDAGPSNTWSLHLSDRCNRCFARSPVMPWCTAFKFPKQLAFTFTTYGREAAVQLARDVSRGGLWSDSDDSLRPSFLQL